MYISIQNSSLSRLYFLIIIPPLVQLGHRQLPKPSHLRMSAKAVCVGQTYALNPSSSTTAAVPNLSLLFPCPPQAIQQLALRPITLPQYSVLPRTSTRA